MLLPISPPTPPAAPILIGSLRSLAALFLPPLILHFFLLFPRPRPIVRSYSAILRWVYVPAIVSLPPLIMCPEPSSVIPAPEHCDQLPRS